MVLAVYVIHYQLVHGGAWLKGVRLDGSKEETIIASDGSIVGEVWDIKAAHHYGCFNLELPEC